LSAGNKAGEGEGGSEEGREVGGEDWRKMYGRGFVFGFGFHLWSQN